MSSEEELPDEEPSVPTLRALREEIRILRETIEQARDIFAGGSGD